MFIAKRHICSFFLDKVTIHIGKEDRSYTCLRCIPSIISKDKETTSNTVKMLSQIIITLHFKTFLTRKGKKLYNISCKMQPSFTCKGFQGFSVYYLQTCIPELVILPVFLLYPDWVVPMHIPSPDFYLYKYILHCTYGQTITDSWV